MGIKVQWQLWFYLLYGLGCRLLRQNATRFLLDDLYRNPGPVQFDGPGADAKAVTLCVEDRDYMGRIKELQKYLDEVLKSCYFFVLYVLIYVCVRACARARNIFQIFIFYLSFMMCVLMQLWIPLSVSLFFFFLFPIYFLGSNHSETRLFTRGTESSFECYGFCDGSSLSNVCIWRPDNTLRRSWLIMLCFLL